MTLKTATIFLSLAACSPDAEITGSASSSTTTASTTSTTTTTSGTTTSTTTTPITVNRRVLHEMFTGSTCGPCYEADEVLEAVLHQNEGDYTVINYQVGSDPYITSEGVSRRMYYLPGESSYAIPYVHADGVNGFHPNEKNGVGYTDEDFDRFAAVPAILNLSVTHEVKGQTVSWEVIYAPSDDITSEDMVLHVAIVEGTTYNNIGTNGQTEFHQVMKKMIPDQHGSPIIVQTKSQAFQGSYTFQGEYAEDAGYGNEVNHEIEHTVEEFEDLEVIVWAQDAVTWEVYQSAWTFDE